VSNSHNSKTPVGHLLTVVSHRVAQNATETERGQLRWI